MNRCDVKLFESPQPESFLTPDSRLFKSKLPLSTPQLFKRDSPLDFFSPQKTFKSPTSSLSTQSSQSTLLSDRCIPFRITTSTKNLFELNQRDSHSTKPESATNSDYNFLLGSQVLDIKQPDLFDKFITPKIKNSLVKASSSTPRNASSNGTPKAKVLQYKTPKKSKTRVNTVPISNFMDIEDESEPMKSKKAEWNIQKTPSKILDAPSLIDDFYLTLIHWSSQNQLAVSLSQNVWIWDGNCGEVTKFSYRENAPLVDYTAVQWNPEGDTLAAGSSDGTLELWDYPSGKCTYTSNYTTNRIDCIAWTHPCVFATGGKDKAILTFDTRAKPSPVAIYQGHTDEVCGLKWSPSGFMLASGGNDNRVFVWNARKQTPELIITHHHSAVKALTWSPHQQHLLLAGGGYTDKKISVWNTISMSMVHEVDAGSQVCNLLFSRNSNDFVSTHGLMGNEIVVWNFDTMEKKCVISGPASHSERVLYLSDSPDGQTIVTGASDETLKFWKVFPEEKKSKPSSLLLNATELR